MSESISSLLHSATERLSASDSARLDAEILLRHVINKDRSYIYAHSEKKLESSQIEIFKKLLEKRSQGFPVAYLTGKKEFWSLEFEVSKDTLIPRSETELLIESILELVDNSSALNLLDLGTGTGAIAIALAKELSQSQLTATDKSIEALTIAKRNAAFHQITNVNFIQSDWFQNIENASFNFIISNPPYISQSDSHLEQGDVQFEPISALSSGEKGLDDLTIIIKESHNFLVSGGYLLLEHGYNQGQDVMSLMEENNYTSIKALYDLSTHHRATICMKN